MPRMTTAEYKKITGRKTNKYNNVKTTRDGIQFDSRAEANHYETLKLMQRAGTIKSFARQPSFILSPNIRYIPDFIVWGNDGIPWVEDVKGVETQVFKIKKKLWTEVYPDMELRIIK